jgi:hypothetical protein
MTFLDLFKKFYWVLIVIGVFIYCQVRIYNLEKIIDITVKSNQEQIDILNKNHDEEMKKKNALIEAHQKELEGLEQEFKIKSNELALERAKKIKVIVRYFENPEKLAGKIIELYGLNYVKKNNNTH